MKRLSNKTNVIAPSVNYPYGELKNDTGIFDGTPVDVELLTDIIQFFERLIDKSGISPNGLPDNLSDGFQLYEALEALSTEIKYSGVLVINTTTDLDNSILLPTGSGTTLASFDGEKLKKVIKSNLTSSYSRRLTSMGIASAGTEIYIPSSSGINFVLNATTGVGSNPPIKKTGTSGNDTNYNPGLIALKLVNMVDFWQLIEL